MNKDLLVILIRELNDLEARCEVKLAKAPKTLKILLDANQAAVDRSFEPGETSTMLRGCIRNMRRVLNSVP